jgi:Ca2+-binding RTX toxin-like protein
MANGTDGDDNLQNTDIINRGLGGNDLIITKATSGFVSLYGDDGNDYLQIGFKPGVSGWAYGGTGTDWLLGGPGADHLLGEAGNDYILGGAPQTGSITGNDEIDGGDGIDGLYGLDGDDVIHGGDGDDESYSMTITFYQNSTITYTGGLYGGDGNDLLYGDAGVDYLYGGTGNDSLVGGTGIDQLLGEDGNDHLEGDDGNDYLSGGTGTDTLVGGTGDDYFAVDSSTDAVFEKFGEGHDKIVCLAAISYSLGFGQEIEELLGASNAATPINLNGNDFAQTIVGGDGDDTIDGEHGADTMKGGRGNDTYYVWDDDDVVIEAADGGIDTVNSFLTSFSLVGQAIENLKFFNSLDNNPDPAVNGMGNELDNTITGNDAANMLSGLDGDDAIEGRGGMDTLAGGSGADVIDGGTHADTLNGVTGEDTLIGGGGADELFGGGQADAFVFQAVTDSTVRASGRDTILDFKHGGHDIIDLHIIDANAKQKGDQAFDFIRGQDFHHKPGELRVEQADDDTLVCGDVDGDGKSDFSILLAGSITLRAGDFAL